MSDTAQAPAEGTPAAQPEASPPRTSTGGEAPPRTTAAPRNASEARGALVRGISARTSGTTARPDGRESTGPTAEERAALPPEPPTPPKVDSTAAKPQNSEQTPPPKASTTAEPAPATASKEAPAEAKSTAPETTEAAPSVEPKASAPAPSTTAPAPEAPPKTQALPTEFDSDELAPLHQFDPTLKRALRRIWNQSDISEVQKIRAMEAKVTQTRQALTETPDPITRRAQLARTGKVDELAEEALADADRQAASLQYLRGVTALLAQAADTDPDDPAFRDAGSKGDTNEERMAHLAEYLVRQSPRGRAILEAAQNETRTSLQAELEQVRAEHAAQIADLTTSWQEKLDTAVAKAIDEVRAGQPAPPRSGIRFPVTSSDPIRPSIEGARGRLALGRKLRDQAVA